MYACARCARFLLARLSAVKAWREVVESAIRGGQAYLESSDSWVRIGWRKLPGAVDLVPNASEGLGDSGAYGRRGVRGKVKVFSAASRMRLSRYFGRIPAGVAPPILITLTLPGEYDPDPAVWRRYRKLMADRLVRRYAVYGFWRLEFQRRGAAHWHFVCWSPRGFICRAWLARNWSSICSGGADHLAAGSRVEVARSPRGWGSYLIREIGKGNQSSCAAAAGLYPAGVGRFWGVIGRARLQVILSPLDVRLLDADDAIAILDAVSALVSARIRGRARVMDCWHWSMIGIDDLLNPV